MMLPSGTELSSFVGREQETAELVKLMGEWRLVTLAGPGGAGKSRLARHVAGSVRYPGGVWWVGLAALAEGAAVAPATAEALRLCGGGQDPAEAVAGRLRGERALLVYDNCEHLADPVTELVTRLLEECPELRVLATSQEVLGIPGELTYAVPPLAVPDEGTSLSELDGIAAVRLFRDRAAAVLPGFTITEATTAAVVQVCRRLEGLPLAVELAAAQTAVLSPAQIAVRLDDCARVLVGNGRAALPRHRTLRATMDWSHGLLPDTERRLFRRLSVFSGSFTLEAVEAIEADALEPLGRLVARSLVTAEHAEHEVRYRLLEPVRQYAAGKLRESGDEGVRERHARFFVGLAERAGSLDPVDAERDNLRSAVRWCLRNRPEWALRSAAVLGWYCYLRGHYGQGRQWLDRSLEAADVPPELRAKALVASGMLAYLQCDYEPATDRLREGLGLYRELADRSGTARALQALGSIARERGDYARARALHEESLGLWSALGDTAGVARSFNYLGFAAWLEQDGERAERLSARAEPYFREAGDAEGLAWALINLGTAALYRGDLTGARNRLTESLALCRNAGYREGIAWSLNQLGVLALRAGEHTEAEGLLRESLDAHRALGDRWRTASVLEALAGAAVARGERALHLIEAAEELRQAIGTPVPPAEKPAYERTLAAARKQVPRVTSPSPLRILGLGSARVYRQDTLIEAADWTYAKPRELLFLLLSENECTKEQIGAALWPCASPAQLRGSFHKALHHLRRALGPGDWVLYRHRRYAFNRSLDYTFDVDAFQTALACARAVPDEALAHLTEAVGLYAGDFLADLPGEQWIDERRSGLSRSYEQALLSLGRLHAAAGRHAEAAEIHLRAVTHNPLLETAHRELIRAYARLGEQGRALRHYKNLVDILRDELDIAPSPLTREIGMALRHGTVL